jgi:hypothetical protein
MTQRASIEGVDAHDLLRGDMRLMHEDLNPRAGVDVA